MRASFGRGLEAALAILIFAGAVLAQESKDEKDLKKLAGDKDKALQLQVNNAVQKGVEYLKSIQNSNGTWTCSWAKYAAPHNYPMGETAITLLALLKSGERGDQDYIKKAFDWLRGQPLQKTYEVSCLLMALEALYAPKAPPPIDPKELTAVAKQKVPVPPADLDWMRSCVEFLLRIRVASQRMFGEDTGAAQAYKDVWHYPMSTGDHSNTQFALLGLKSASKCGIQIPEEVWVYALKHFLEVQEKDGPKIMRMQLIEDRQHGYVSYKPLTGKPDTARGWGYGATVDPKGGSSDDRYATTGSMTCVGISSIAIALAELGPKCPPPLKDRGEQSIWDGIAWLETHWKVDTNPEHPQKRWVYYYLYGLERTGVLTWQRAFGKHDWYREGAEWLIANQGGGGSWEDKVCGGPVNSTCFALLFLTRATVPGRAVVTGGPGGH